MIIRSAELMDKIQDWLTILQARIKISNALGQTDVNKAAEDFYCGLLNIVFGDYHLKNLNLLQMDFPAIDLGDEENRLCVQVTSTEGREKVRSTLRKFFENDLHLKFDRLIVLIIGEKGNYRKDFDVEPGFDFDHTRDVWDTAKLLQEISALKPDQMEAVADYLHTALNIPDAPVPPHLPLHTSLGVDGFIGRQAELESLAQALRNGAKPILLSGLGGIGKTELASRFGQSYTKGRVYLASFQNSFRDTVTHSIAKGIPNLLEKKLPEDEVYHTVMARLGQCPKDDILILDNVDRENGSYYDLLDDTYNSLCGLDLRLILTTRFEVAGAIEIKQLSNQELYQIFRKHKVNISPKEMDALIQAVDGHTLTIDLMARTMTGTWKKVTADMLLTALQEKDLPNKDYRRVPTDYNRTNRQERIYEHLRTMFNVAGVPEAARAVLCYATLLPQDGMDAETFGMALQEEEQQALDDLINHGWLAVKDDTLTIHPVVRLVCREELKPSDEVCENFLGSVWEQYDEDKYDRDKYRQLAEFYSVAAETLEDRIGNCALVAGIIWYQLGDAPKTLKYTLLAVSQKEQTFGLEHPELISAYANLGTAYSLLGDNCKALELHQKALNTKLNFSTVEDPYLATLYCSVGQSYTDNGDYHTAIGYLLQSLSIWKKHRPEDHPDLSTIYNNLGFAYSCIEEHKLALYYLEKSLYVKGKVVPDNHPKNASCYDNIGRIHYCLGDYQKALYYRKKALDIREQTLPKNHHSIAASYNNIGLIYSTMRDYNTSLQYQKKSLSISKVALPFGHPNLALAHCNLASTLWEMGSTYEAVDYLRVEKDNAISILSPEHPYSQELIKAFELLKSHLQK